MSDKKPTSAERALAKAAGSMESDFQARLDAWKQQFRNVTFASFDEKHRVFKARIGVEGLNINWMLNALRDLALEDEELWERAAELAREYEAGRPRPTGRTYY